MDNRFLLKYKKNICSQRGEDGVLEKIFEVLGVKHGWCVDVGAYGKNLSNTYVLISKGWSGVLIEANEEKLSTLKRYHGYSHRDVHCICAYVEPSGERSLDNLLKSTPLPKDFEFLSIDIDGNDYYIWESLKDYSPLVVIIEFDASAKFADYLQPVDGNGGASLSVMVKLGKLKGYELICAMPFNAIFVKKDLFNIFGIKNNSPQEMWIPEEHDFNQKQQSLPSPNTITNSYYSIDNLDKDSLVIDAGGYLGDFTAKLGYNCNVIIFEPVPEFFEYCKERFKVNPHIKIECFGLGTRDGVSKLYVRKDASSFYKKWKWAGSSDSITANTIQLSKYIKGFPKVDLLKLNIEGAEYDVLDDLAENKQVSKIKTILVQFHAISGFRIRYKMSQKILSETHQKTRGNFKWETWKRM
jgi:FkbM family methyltransferase